MAYTKLIPRFTSGAYVEEISSGIAYRLSIPAGAADTYRLAQLDDYVRTRRSRFPLRHPIRLTLSARTSSEAIPGTWGFGLWNDPFGLSLGFGGNPFRLPTLPNAVWFFGASTESYLLPSDSPTGETARLYKRSFVTFKKIFNKKRACYDCDCGTTSKTEKIEFHDCPRIFAVSS